MKLRGEFYDEVFLRPDGRISAMGSELDWETISTAPFDRDLELAVVEGGRVYPLIFACRRTARGWIRVPSMERVTVNPTHWRLWSRTG